MKKRQRSVRKTSDRMPTIIPILCIAGFVAWTIFRQYMDVFHPH